VSLASWTCRFAGCCILAFEGGSAKAEIGTAEQELLVEVTNIFQIRQIAAQNPDSAYHINLEGDVWWTDHTSRLVLKDYSGAEELEMDLGEQKLEAGQRIRITENGTITKRFAAFQLGGKGPVVDNNGVHAAVEKSGAIYLNAGLHPLRLEWFNGVERYELSVEYTGPGFPRQRIPAPVLHRPGMALDEPKTNLVQGLEYRCYAVDGEALPDFQQLIPLKTGTVENFDLGVLPQPEHVGLVFTGLLEVTNDGLYKFFTKSDDGSRLYVTGPKMHVDIIGKSEWPLPKKVAIGQILIESERNQWSEIEGKVSLARKELNGARLELGAGSARIEVEIADSHGLEMISLLDSWIRAVGFCEGALTPEGQMIPGVLLVPGRQQIQLLRHQGETIADTSTNAGALPTLTTAVEVHRLKREEAQRGYRVKLRGVVTCVLPEHQAFTLQDSTRGLYVVDSSQSLAAPPEVGEYLDIEGTTDPGMFAPVVNARSVVRKGPGHLPGPVRPAWDQLMSGSLDAQYVEFAGVVTAVQTNFVTLLTSGGIVKVDVRPNGVSDGAELKQFENALVRVRGCLFATWDYITHQVRMGEIRMYGPDILVDQPAPADLFSTPRKTAAELRLFDPQAGAFQRVKVAGQLVFVAEGQSFLIDGGEGLRFVPQQVLDMKLGDTIEVVGFPDLLGGASPVLREAVARKTGHSPLPSPTVLSATNMLSATHDATLVKVEGSLVNIHETRPDTVLEMQNGVRAFTARIKHAGESTLSLTAGSRLELTGVYAGLGGNRAVGQEITSFELLIDSVAGIKVLARPPWWTLKRLLVATGALGCVLAAAGLWITQLHRQVDERSAQLAAQIQERQQIEHQRTMEEERTRIAQDLHDELGSGITEIGMLAARAKSTGASDEKRERHLDQVGAKARELVTALDEIVWAMNPRHDSVASVVSYLSLYAERFLKLANISWRLDGPNGTVDQVVDSRRRHQLFLAFKEALTNVVRHSGASEVQLNIRCDAAKVLVAIADNGRGLPTGSRTENMDGVSNMRNRIEKLGGRFEITGHEGMGTTVRFDVPYN
jgi:signal transduction histidine kinase